MRLDKMESFNIIHKPCCFSSPSHSSCKTSPEDGWKSPVKIMLGLGLILGINNLWSHTHTHSSGSTSRSIKHGTSIWTLSIIISVVIFATCADAYPAASAVSRMMRDHHARHFLGSGSSGMIPPAQTSFNEQDGSSGDANLSLSIFSPLDILRQNMLLEIHRKRMRHAKQRQMQSNKEYLDRIGR